MPTVIDPQFGCKYSWETRGDSFIHMQNKLFLPADEIDLTISIHRSVLYLFLKPTGKPYALMRAGLAFSKLAKRPPEDDLLSPEARRLLNFYSKPRRLKELSFSQEGISRVQRLMALFYSPRLLSREIASGLENLRKKTPRRGFISGPILDTGARGAKLSMSAESWQALGRFFGSPEDKNHPDFLSDQIWLLFLSPSTLNRILEPARGRWAGRPVLGDYLPQAYFACRELVLMSEAKDREALGVTDENGNSSYLLDPKELADLIETVLCRLPDQAAESYWESAQSKPKSYRNQMAVVCLVYRAFYGAWQRCGVEGLPEPQAAFREHLYGHERKTLSAAFRNLGTELKIRLIEKWIALYLSPEPGAATIPHHLPRQLTPEI